MLEWLGDEISPVLDGMACIFSCHWVEKLGLPNHTVSYGTASDYFFQMRGRVPQQGIRGGDRIAHIELSENEKEYGCQVVIVVA